MLQVLKLRGSGFLSGKHAYRLSAAGIEVFPRLADPVDQAAYSLPTERISSGIPVLDTMLTDGYWPGAATLVAGPSGAGKTLMGLHFVVSGARRGEPGIIATLRRTRPRRVAQGIGYRLAEDGIELLYRSPADLYIDQWVHELLAAIERTGARRVLIDSLGDLALPLATRCATASTCIPPGAALLPARGQPADDLRAARAVPARPAVGGGCLPRVRQRRGAAVPAPPV